MPGPLGLAPSDIVRNALIDLGLGAYPPDKPWPIHSGVEPGSPDHCITIYDTRGRQHGRDMVTNERAEHQGIQVRVRCVKPNVGYKKADQIAIALDRDMSHIEVTPRGDDNPGTFVINTVVRTTNTVYAGTSGPKDTRTIYTINALVSVRGPETISDIDTGRAEGDEGDPAANFPLEEGSGTTITSSGVGAGGITSATLVGALTWVTES